MQHTKSPISTHEQFRTRERLQICRALERRRAEDRRNGQPIEGSGFLAPVVLDDLCVGCGLCQTRCYAINVKQKHLLAKSAIIIQAGGNREDRLLEGSYIELRQSERSNQPSIDSGTNNYFIPDSDALDPLNTTSPTQIDPASDDPFGVGHATQGAASDTTDDPFGVGN